MTKNNFGVFEITVPAVNGQPAIPHDSKIKVSENAFAGHENRQLTFTRSLSLSQMIMPAWRNFPLG
jgi:hypothetical protein